MTTREAHCSCGALRVSVEGEPVRVSICHCLACQRRTGALFSAQARFARANVRIRGVSREFVRRGDSGGLLRFHFCPDCGATVHYQQDEQPDLIAIPVGAFADPDFPPAWISVYESRRHAWLQRPPTREHHD